jgi:hypothetical protein
MNFDIPIKIVDEEFCKNLTYQLFKLDQINDVEKNVEKINLSIPLPFYFIIIEDEVKDE